MINEIIKPQWHGTREQYLTNPNIDKYTAYVTDIPQGTINNADMELATTTQSVFYENKCLYLCTDSGTYKQNTFYQFDKTNLVWNEIAITGGSSNTGIEWFKGEKHPTTYEDIVALGMKEQDLYLQDDGLIFQLSTLSEETIGWAELGNIKVLVAGNPEDVTPTEELKTIYINGTTYSIPSGSTDGAVLYNQVQTLTDEQKQTARENIGVTSGSTISDTIHITGENETEINIPFKVGKKYNIQGNILRNSGVNNCFHFYNSDGNSIAVKGVWQSYLASKSSNGSTSITSYFYYLSNDTTNNSMLLYDNNANNQTTFVNINIFIRELDGKYCLQYNSKTSAVTFPNNNAGMNQQHDVQGVFWCDTLPAKMAIVTATADVPYTYDLYIDEVSAKSGSSSETEITDLQLNSTINSVEVIG